jgi:hypothetical protein
VSAPEVPSLLRLDAFRKAHPGIAVEKGTFGEWYAYPPLDDSDGYAGGGCVLHDPDLGVLLDKLEAEIGSG